MDIARPDLARKKRVRQGLYAAIVVAVLIVIAPGDRVILSDMSAWDAFDRVRVN